VENSGDTDSQENDTEVTDVTDTDKNDRRHKIWRRVRRGCYTLVTIAIIGPLTAFASAYFVLDARSPQEVLAGLDKTVDLKYSDGSEMMKVVPAGGDRIYVPYAKIPQKLRDSIIAVEDPTFWDNEGFDPLSIVRAAVTGFGGGSGLTQQYIKNSTGNDAASALRKFRELVLSTKITQQQSKEQIFESYINIISFGRTTSGPASAMQAFFGRKLDNSITWSEAAFLAGMIQSPSGHDPAASGPAHAAKRWQYVADKLTSRGYVSTEEAARMRYPGDAILAPSETRAGRVTYSEYHVKQQVLAELEQQGFPLSRLQQGSMTVETTIDRNAQQSSEQVVNDRLGKEPDYFRSALVALEPTTGAVRAYQGGKWSVHDYAATPYATGSAFAPFIIAAGLRQGASLDATYPAPFKVDYGGQTFKNQVDCTSDKNCSVAESVQGPVDTPLVEMTQNFGVDAVSKAARDAGIPAQLDGKPTLREPDGVTIGSGIAGGRYPLRPLDMATGYATFADDGLRVTPYFVSKIRDEHGAVIWAHPPSRVPAFGGADQSHEIADGIDRVLTRPDIGLADGRPSALLAGSSRFTETGDNANAWTIGYTPQLVTAVWVGSDEERRMRDSAGAKLTGKTVPADIWRSFMGAFHTTLPVRSFR
jgi:membrane peptidoglycan carboxypeptidase